MFLMGEGLPQDDNQASFWYAKAAAQGHESAKHNLENLNRIAESLPTTADTATATPAQIIDVEQSVDGMVDDEQESGIFSRLFKRKPSEEPNDVTEIEPTDTEMDDSETVTSMAEETVVEDVETEAKRERGFFGRLFNREPSEEPTDAEMDEPKPVSSTAEEDYERGLIFSLGEGDNKDAKLAFSLFLSAAQKDYAPAQYKAGIAYAYGEGTDIDLSQAAYWDSLVSDQGYAIAQRNLGVMYENGNRVEQNKPLALAWYDILADNGNVMDIRRRDMLASELTGDEVTKATQLKDQLLNQLKTKN